MPALARLGLLGLIWGSSFLFIKVALEGISPGQVVLGRLLAGLAVLAVYLLVTGARLPRPGPVWGHLLFTAVVANVVPFFLFAWGEERVASSTAGVLNATTPLFTTIAVTVSLRGERPTGVKLLGIVVGFVGVVVVIGGGAGGGTAAGQIACVAAALCYGIAFAYTRRFLTPTGLSPLVLSVGQLGTASLIMLLATPVVASTPVDLDARIVGSILALGAMGTGVAYVLYYGLIRDIGATGASMVTYLVPIAAVLLGVVFLGEDLGLNVLLGAPIVILGVALAEGRLSRPVPYEGMAAEGIHSGRLRS